MLTFAPDPLRPRFVRGGVALRVRAALHRSPLGHDLSSGATAATLRPEADRLATRLEEHFAYEESRLLPALAREA
ncbi:hypothetical protein ACFQ7J_07230 [Streptomyces sp. NPDC056501]|uniref:hypothetical protein n=1 Tax=Streptomyces sp. NPDC056501 TaxID=3345841 RepID=UPI0036C42AD9